MNTAKMIINVFVDLLKLFVKVGFFNKLIFVGAVNLVLLMTGLLILVKNKKKNAPIRIQ